MSVIVMRIDDEATFISRYKTMGEAVIEMERDIAKYSRLDLPCKLDYSGKWVADSEIGDYFAIKNDGFVRVSMGCNVDWFALEV